MIDAIAIIRDHILRRYDVYERTAARLYGGYDTPPPGHKPGDGEFITFMIRGGGDDYDGALLIPSVQVKCYAETRLAADALSRITYEQLHQSSGLRVLKVQAEGLWQILEEPDTEWTFGLLYFTFWLQQREL